jgi:hypothetical protein
MKNGSIEFVAVIAEKFKCYIEPYVFYEYSVDYEDHGFASKDFNAKLENVQGEFWIYRKRRRNSKWKGGKQRN